VDVAHRNVLQLALKLGTGASDREACALAAKVFELDGAQRGARPRPSSRPRIRLS